MALRNLEDYVADVKQIGTTIGGPKSSDRVTGYVLGCIMLMMGEWERRQIVAVLEETTRGDSIASSDETILNSVLKILKDADRKKD